MLHYGSKHLGARLIYVVDDALGKAFGQMNELQCNDGARIKRCSAHTARLDYRVLVDRTLTGQQLDYVQNPQLGDVRESRLGLRSARSN